MAQPQGLRWRARGPKWRSLRTELKEGRLPPAKPGVRSGLQLIDAGVVNLRRLAPQSEYRIDVECRNYPLDVLDIDGSTEWLVMRPPKPGWNVDATLFEKMPVSIKNAKSIKVLGWGGLLTADWHSHQACSLEWTGETSRTVKITAFGNRRIRIEGIRHLEVKQAERDAAEIEVTGSLDDVDRLHFEISQGELSIVAEEPLDTTVTVWLPPRMCTVEIVDVIEPPNVGDVRNHVVIRNRTGQKWDLGNVAEVSGHLEKSHLRIASARRVRLTGREADVSVAASSNAELVRVALHGGSLKHAGACKRLEVLALRGATVTVGDVATSAVVRAIHATVRFGGPAIEMVRLFADTGATIEHTGTRKGRKGADRLRVREGTIRARWLRPGDFPVEVSSTDQPASNRLHALSWDLQRTLEEQGVMQPTLTRNDGKEDTTAWTTLGIAERFAGLDAGHAHELPDGDRLAMIGHRDPAADDRRVAPDLPTLLRFGEGPIVATDDAASLFLFVPDGLGVCVAVYEEKELSIGLRPYPGATLTTATLPPARVAALLSLLSAHARLAASHAGLGAVAASVAALACTSIITDEHDSSPERLLELIEFLDSSAWEAVGVQPSTKSLRRLHDVLMVAIDRFIARAGSRDVVDAGPVDWFGVQTDGIGTLAADHNGVVSINTAAATLRLGAPTRGVSCGELVVHVGEPTTPRRLALSTSDELTFGALLLLQHWLAYAGHRDDTEPVIAALGDWPHVDLGQVYDTLSGIAEQLLRREGRQRLQRLSQADRQLRLRLERLLDAARPQG
jgi:hypothetical protein